MPEIMALAVGTKLGVYEIMAPLGEGGMGVVFRAADTKLSREVAIKVLPEAFTHDPDRMARFEREAKLLAALNHPNIAAIYAVESSALVMELVEGDTLAERIRQGAIPMDEALPIARQIAHALEAAHLKTIIHRDLKPANIKITPAGVVKVLDFGLAKASASEAAQLPEQSPTLSLTATQAGVIMGTATYMAPEQARGKPVDKRADIWAFGCVLYEMLSGRRAFAGESTTEILAAVLKSEPDWAALPRGTPPNVLRVLRRCLAKDPARRLHDIADANLELTEDLVSEPSTPRRSGVPWRAAVATCLAFGFFAGVWWQNRRAPRETNWTAERLGGSLVAMGPRVSPDGQLLAFQAMVNGITQVAVLKPASANWTLLSREESKGYVYEISWSLDGTKLFYSRGLGEGGGIYSVPVLGGDERLVLENAGFPAELPDGSLLFARRNENRRYQLYRYWPETGRVQSLKALIRVANSAMYRVCPNADRVVFLGTPIDSPDAPGHLYALDLRTEQVTRLAPGQSIAMISPFALAVSADSRSVLFTSTGGDLHRIVSVPIDGSAGERTLFTQTTSTGFLDVGTDGSIYADQWDRPHQIVRFSPSGGPVEQIGEALDSVAGFEAIALQDGRIVYTSRVAGRRRLVVTGAGKDAVPLLETQEETSTPAAPVGNGQIAFVMGTSSNQVIGLASIANGRILRRLEGTANGTISGIASFPDGQIIYYAAAGSIWSIPTAGGEPKRLGPGDSVTVDPIHHDLIVRLDEKDGASLVRMPLTGAPVRQIPVSGDVRIVSGAGWLNATAVGKDGNLLVQVAAGSLWTWPVGLLNPETGSTRILTIPYLADMPTPGWGPDGKVVVVAEPIRSSLWRFRPAK